MTEYFAKEQLQSLASYRAGRREKVYSRVLEAAPDYPAGMTARLLVQRGVFENTRRGEGRAFPDGNSGKLDGSPPDETREAALGIRCTITPPQIVAPS